MESGKFCEEYKDREFSFYCQNDNIWFCDICIKYNKKCDPFPIHYIEILEDYRKNREMFSPYLCEEKIKEIIRNIKKKRELIEEIFDITLGDLNEICAKMKTKENEKKTVDDAIAIINDRNDPDKVFNIVKEFIEKNKRIISDLEAETPKKINSTTLKHRNYERITDWLGKKYDFKLLYRASRDGFDSNKFHELCDNITPTLVIIRTDYKKIIGGISFVAWKNDSNTYVSNPNSFLFSLTVEENYPINVLNMLFIIITFQVLNFEVVRILK